MNEQQNESNEDVVINNMSNLVDVLIEEINLLKKGKITPSRSHAMANLTGKIMQAVKLTVETHKYVQRLDSAGSSVPLMDFALKERGVLQKLIDH